MKKFVNIIHFRMRNKKKPASTRENAQKHRAVFTNPRRERGQKVTAVVRTAERTPHNRETH